MRNQNLISLIVPVHNEGESIKTFLDLVKKSVLLKHEILIVYDFEEDNTVPIVKRLLKENWHNIKLVKNTLGSGVLSAIKTGLQNTSGKLIVIIPADLADHPKTITVMYKKMLEGFDIVCATRFSKGGKKLGGGRIKSILAKLAGLGTPILLGIPTTDLSNGFKMYKKEVFQKIEIQSDGGWEFTIEVLVKAHHMGFKVGETPSIWKDRVHGKSNFKFKKWLPKYLRWYIFGIKKRLMLFRLMILFK